jgi:hypothetical protein
VVLGQKEPAVHALATDVLAGQYLPTPHGTGVTVPPAHTYPEVHMTCTLGVAQDDPALHGLATADPMGQ